MITITVLNGPNLGSLGHREPEVYGDVTASQLQESLREFGGKLGCAVDFSRHETQGGLTGAISAASGVSEGLIINPGAFSHTSVAVMDAMRAFQGPVIEVHISQIHRREPFRHRMLTAMGADVVISGAGTRGYLSAMEIIMELLRR